VLPTIETLVESADPSLFGAGVAEIERVCGAGFVSVILYTGEALGAGVAMMISLPVVETVGLMAPTPRISFPSASSASIVNGVDELLKYVKPVPCDPLTFADVVVICRDVALPYMMMEHVLETPSVTGHDAAVFYANSFPPPFGLSQSRKARVCDPSVRSSVTVHVPLVQVDAAGEWLPRRRRP
jgi:hypothetical protein